MSILFFVYATLFIGAVIISTAITPIVKKLAVIIGAVDYPDARKVHSRIMPRMGGLAIALTFIAIMLLVSRSGYIRLTDVNFADKQFLAFLAGISIILMIGIIDDKWQISAKYKLIGQLLAAGIVINAGITVQYVTLPDQSIFNFGWLAIPITLFWIVGVTNALNLIDGLDGLAAGVASIALATITIIGFTMGNVVVATMALILLGSTLGFLVHNFYPAKLFMGDTGSMFLGFCLAVFSILGFKHVTLISFIIPILILGVPIADTLLAIIRRFISEKAISEPDKHHLHHCLLKMGYSHKTTVFIIYGISMFFGLTAIVFSQAASWIAISALGVLLVVAAIGADLINILDLNSQQRTRDTQFSFRKFRI